MNTAATAHARVTFKGRSYLVIWVKDHALVSVEFSRWAGLGMIQTTRTVQPGPTRTAVLKLANATRA